MNKRNDRLGLRERASELRRNQTDAEARLWKQLRNRQLGGYKFRRQAPVGRFIVDFLCIERGLVIELDGAVHDYADQADYDQERSAALIAHGYQVVRFSNAQIEQQLAAVLLEIAHYLNAYE